LASREESRSGAQQKLTQQSRPSEEDAEHERLNTKVAKKRTLTASARLDPSKRDNQKNEFDKSSGRQLKCIAASQHQGNADRCSGDNPEQCSTKEISPCD
jgi:hypothetical protein